MTAQGAGAGIFESDAGDGEGARLVLVWKGAAAEEISGMIESANRPRACFGRS